MTGWRTVGGIVLAAALVISLGANAVLLLEVFDSSTVAGVNETYAKAYGEVLRASCPDPQELLTAFEHAGVAASYERYDPAQHGEMLHQAVLPSYLLIRQGPQPLGYFNWIAEFDENNCLQ